VIVVFSRPGRESLTAATLHDLEVHGGGHYIPHERKALFWTGETPPPSGLPWRAICFPQAPAGNVPDFWLLLRTFQDVDLCVFEDDVQPCANALPYIEHYPTEHLTTFYNPRQLRQGLQLVDGSGFNHAQAIKLPRELAARLRVEDPTTIPDHRFYDNVIGAFLTAWREPYRQHRSLVEHTGRVSIARPGALRAHAAPDFDRAFDALLLGRTEGQS
jgi:hypothetical protein